MPAPETALSRLNDLHRFYDGEIPESERRAALLGAETVEIMAAVGQVAFFKSAIKAQVRIIRARRADGSFYPALIADLQLYRRRFRQELRALWKLRAAADARPAAMAAE